MVFLSLFILFLPAKAAFAADARPTDTILAGGEEPCQGAACFLSARANAGFFPGPRYFSLGPFFENYGGNWRSRYTDPEAALAYARVPPLFELTVNPSIGFGAGPEAPNPAEEIFGHPKGNGRIAEGRGPAAECGEEDWNCDISHNSSGGTEAGLLLRLRLLRDMAAWEQDELGANIPLGAKEVNINEPSLGFLALSGPLGALRLGRFPVHLGPHPHFGLAASRQVPYHDALLLALPLREARFLFLASSLHPWLEGTPASPGDSFPAGSEEWRQRHYSPRFSNAHHRVYAEKQKTLLVHRLEVPLFTSSQRGRAGSPHGVGSPRGFGPLTLGLTEAILIGGKAPSLRDANPFIFYHNNYNDGYQNTNLAFDFSLSLPFGFRPLSEVFLDDIRYAETEKGGGTPSVTGLLFALEHEASGRRGRLRQIATVVRTDPFLYHHWMPLTRYSSRHMVNSNFQDEGESFFVDRYVVDYPLGYARGADCRDLWYRALWEAPSRTLSGGMGPGPLFTLRFEAASLRRGPGDFRLPYEAFIEGRTAPGGADGTGAADSASSATSAARPRERELRLRLSGDLLLRRRISLRAGLFAGRLVQEGEGGIRREWRAQGEAGLAWAFP